jgi:hypothetical protein
MLVMRVNLTKSEVWMNVKGAPCCSACARFYPMTPQNDTDFTRCQSHGVEIALNRKPQESVTFIALPQNEVTAVTCTGEIHGVLRLTFGRQPRLGFTPRVLARGNVAGSSAWRALASVRCALSGLDP